MQHTHTQDLPIEGHNALWRGVKYLSLAGIVIVAVYEHSPALLAILAGISVLVYALSEKARKLDADAPRTRVYDHRLIGDGGCFPCDEPEQDKPATKPARVLDGGSLEHHRT
ncbi:MAG: hypothetical protein P8178_07925 [Candidatus Thiodiazotropha sp.]